MPNPPKALAPGQSIADLTPAELGLPERFAKFRREQVEAVELGCNSQKRHVGLCLPTGAGKGLMGVTLHVISGERTAILTHTLGLMQQYIDDYSQNGIVSIMGRSNYPCADRELDTDCRLGPHAGCRFTGGMGCTYESARDTARAADLVVTNYAYWVKANQWGSGLELSGDDSTGQEPNPFGLLIMDEAHLAFEALAGALRVSLRESWMRVVGVEYDKDQEDVGYWSGLAVRASAVANQQMAEATRKLREFGRSDKSHRVQKLRQRVKELDEIKDCLERMAGFVGGGSAGDWVCEQRKGTDWGRTWDFDCVWPAQYAESRLFLGVPKVVEMSATLKPMAVHMLGVGKGELEFREWPRVFPANHTPVYYQPSLIAMDPTHPEKKKQIRLNYHTTPMEWVKVIQDMDDWIEPRLMDGRSGLIHTVSYDRQQMVMGMSRWREFMIGNTSDPDSPSAQQKFEEYKERVRGGERCILISPSFSTGWDLPGRLCEWQVILKLSFKPASKIMQARLERFPQYQDYRVMQDFIQSIGRASRFYADRCEVLVKDGNLAYFLSKNRGLAPIGFEVVEVKSGAGAGAGAGLGMRARAPEGEVKDYGERKGS